MINSLTNAIQYILSLFDLRDSLLRNSIYILVANFLGTALGFLYWIVAANYYPVSAIGKVGALISAVGILSAVGSIGIDYSLLKYLSSDMDKNSLVTTSLLVVIGSSILFSVLYLFGTIIFQGLPNLSHITYALLFIVTIPSLSIYNLFHKSIFISFRKSSYSVVLAVISYTRLLIAPALVGVGSYGLFSSFSISVTAAAVLGILITYAKLLSNQPKLNKLPYLRKIVTYSFGNYLADLFDRGIIYGVPLVTISLLGATEGGYFYIAWQIGVIFITIPKMLMKPLLSEGSRKYTKTSDLVIKAAVLVIGIQVIGILLFIAFGDVILNTFGETYTDNSYQLVLVISIGGIIYTVNILYTTIMRINGNLQNVIWNHGQIALVTLILTYVFGGEVVQIGAGTGAGFAWIFANTLTFVSIICHTCVKTGEIWE